jgi:hypothetical protein
VTGRLERAAAWFVTPIGSSRPTAEDEPPLRVAGPDEPAVRVAREDELVDLAALGYADGRFAPPVARRTADRPPHGPAAEPALAPSFVAPSSVAPPLAVAAPRAIVLGAPPDVAVAAAAVALELRRRRRTGAAVVVVCAATAGEPPALPAPTLAAPGLPGARLLARRLARRDHPASAHGRLVWVPLATPAEDVGAVEARIAAAAGHAPVVLALPGPRSAAADAVLAGHDTALLAAAPDSPLADLAGEDLRRLGVPLHCWAPPAGGAARVAALAGWRAPAGLPDLAAA